MILKSIRVRHFRAIVDEVLACDNLTALVGPNGAGKSCFLRALELFYSPSPKFSPEDCYANDLSRDTEIELTFGDLDSEERTHFASYIQDSALGVARVLSLASGRLSAKYYGARMQNSDFGGVRAATGAREATAKYNELRQTPTYEDLPQVRSRDAALEALETWEASHPDRCSRQRDDGQFFGFTEVAQGYLGRFTRFILIPAVRDAGDDAVDGRGSPISEIMDLVVRSALANRADLAELKRHIEAEYEKIVSPDMPELSALAGRLSSTLKTYVPFADVSLQWTRGLSIELPMPKADVRLSEDGFSCAVARTGHGLQRAFILTMLQHLGIAEDSGDARRANEGAAEASSGSQAQRLPDLILGIEEPELFQHPSRQRHFAKVLSQLANGSISGVARRTQVIYATHSPLFVGIDRINQIRLVRKVDGEATKPRATRVVRTTLDEITNIIWNLSGHPAPRFTPEGMRARLHSIMTPWLNEGFFADVVVLVEGEDDRAAILGVASSNGHDLESEGTAVIPCGGKDSLDRPAVIFRCLKIPTYVLWDGDHGNPRAKPERNRYLLRLVGSTEEDWPAAVSANFACFKRTLEATLREEIGEEVFDRLLAQAQDQFGVSRQDQALKNPSVVRCIVDAARDCGRTSPTLEAIVSAIRAFRFVAD